MPLDDFEIRSLATDLKTAGDGLRRQTGELSARMTELEQLVVGGAGFHGDVRAKSWGTTLVESDDFKHLKAANGRGQARVEVEAKATLTSAPTSGGALVPIDYDTNVVTLARRRQSILDLCWQGETTSNSIAVALEETYANAAAPVAEGALKPESTITYKQVVVPVKTIAHLLPVSKQILDDATQLRDTVDGSLRWGLADQIEKQVLLGAGVGEDLNGIYNQATAFDSPFTITGGNRADVLLQAIAQAEMADLPASGIIMNSADWSAMMALKGSDGHYLGGGPWSVSQPSMWGLPVVATTQMPLGSYLVGNFNQAVRVYHRMQAEVLISQDHADFFARNLLMLRCEARLAVAVVRKNALIKGTFPALPT